MGCDIHAVIEYREINTDYWQAGAVLHLGRSYEIFCRVADCGRGGHPPLVANRGLPTGLAIFNDVREDADHSYTWLTADEFSSAVQQAKEDMGVDAHDWRYLPDYGAAVAMLRFLQTHTAEVRIVIGFDN